MISSSCDKGAEGCTDSSLCDYNGDGVIDEYCACNYDDSFVVDDGSCQYPNENQDCKGNCVADLDCFGVCGGTAETDCCGLCDNVEGNNPPEESDGNCIDDVVCGCTELTQCNYNQHANHDDGSCASDLSSFGGLSNGEDCNGNCGGSAVMDNCELCIDGEADTSLGHSWRLKIISEATFKLSNDLQIGSYRDSVTLGSSIFAKDGYNGVDLDGGDPSCHDCYIDIPEPPVTDIENKNNFIRFYFPHNEDSEQEEWESQFDSDIDPLFDSDIRANDYHSLFTEEKGMNWFAVIEPTLSDTVIIDSIKFQITHLEGIKCSLINIYLDRGKGEISGGIEYVVENNQLGIEVESDKEINITINVSNICIWKQEFDESCLDNY